MRPAGAGGAAVPPRRNLAREAARGRPGGTRLGVGEVPPDSKTGDSGRRILPGRDGAGAPRWHSAGVRGPPLGRRFGHFLGGWDLWLWAARGRSVVLGLQTPSYSPRPEAPPGHWNASSCLSRE
ncbi:unnamed protein product [Rangifer tarandus platyrhynchus]|uniref:Uncharacterized protein n=2 Tax=Rangifer tarandus platyrhynchus TaxID=3082113 RepID=A0ABN8ZNR5_RANTA|nr:unnamed protein product [Rangifer tarandus platyrhynchus]CAI9709885.1 unnamed protein product [Rangifer tarandus platyrhynchus]